MLEAVEEELSHGVVVEEAPEVVELEDSEAKVAEVLVSLDVQAEEVSEDTVAVAQGVGVETAELLVELVELAEDSDSIVEDVQGTEEVDVSEVTEDSKPVVSLVGAVELPGDTEVSEVEQGEVVPEDSVVSYVDELSVVEEASLVAEDALDVSEVVLEEAVVSCVTVVLIEDELLWKSEEVDSVVESDFVVNEAVVTLVVSDVLVSVCDVDEAPEVVESVEVPVLEHGVDVVEVCWVVL